MVIHDRLVQFVRTNERTAHALLIGTDAFGDTAHKLRRDRKFGELAQFLEMAAIADLLILRHRSDISTVYEVDVITYLIHAAYWYREAGEDLLAGLTAERVLLELEGFFQKGWVPDRLYHPRWEWYLREMMGDAAMLVDPASARLYYELARVGFETITDIEETVEEYHPVIMGYRSIMAYFYGYSRSPYERIMTKVVLACTAE